MGAILDEGVVPIGAVLSEPLLRASLIRPT